MDFGIMFFSSTAQRALDTPRYAFLMEVARFADQHGFSAVWTPERHFHEFGGLFPNPAVISAALAMVTERVQLRAGSLISPLHDPIRVVEDWSVVDNLSNGRVAISFGSGWNVDDFIFFPDRYTQRQEIMFDQIVTVRKLWGRERLQRENSLGRQLEIETYPPPVQQQLPVWVTSSGNEETFRRAGEIGAHILTHLLGQNLEDLAAKIEVYRAALAHHHGPTLNRKVSLMLHTFIGPDPQSVRGHVEHPLRDYLRSAINLEKRAAEGGGVISGGHNVDPRFLSQESVSEIIDIAFERYVTTGALIGTAQSCQDFVWNLKRIGVDEIACLIDFGVPDTVVLDNLRHLNDLRAAFSSAHLEQTASEALSGFMQDFDD